MEHSTNRPDIPVVPLREAAQILGVSVEAAKSSLRHHGVRSGYPLDAVQWLATNRPGRGARTDLKETAMNAAEYGTLTDYTTGAELRPATRDEWLASLDAGETGAFEDADGRTVFVAGGPETTADDPATASLDLAAITLPDGIHADILRGRDVVDGSDLAVVVLWADRTFDTCPRCHEPVDVNPGCPVVLHAGAGQGGQVVPVDQRHHCGEWLAVAWTQMVGADGVTDGDVLADARLLAEARQREMDQGRRKLNADLRQDLNVALRRLAEPLDADETWDERVAEATTGSQTEPGVYIDGSRLVAWMYLPVASQPDDFLSVEAEIPDRIRA